MILCMKFIKIYEGMLEYLNVFFGQLKKYLKYSMASSITNELANWYKLF